MGTKIAKGPAEDGEVDNMRLHIVFYAGRPVSLPWHYPHLLHGYLFRAIAEASPHLGYFLHDKGFVAESHTYKMMVFSKLYPRRASSTPQALILTPPIHWWVSSPLPDPMEALAVTLLKEKEAVIGGTHLEVERVEVEPPPDLSGRVLGETISPLVASTGVRRGERLHKRFLAPEEPDFWRVIEDNLRRKAASLGISLSPDAQVKFAGVGKWRSRLLLAQGTQVRGYEGRFLLEGDRTLLRLAYEAGLGERNSQGFGMFRIVGDQQATEAKARRNE